MLLGIDEGNCDGMVDGRLLGSIDGTLERSNDGKLLGIEEGTREGPNDQDESKDNNRESPLNKRIVNLVYSLRFNNTGCMHFFSSFGSR